MFPTSKEEALALIYLQSQNLSGIEAEELTQKYDEILDRIKSSVSNRTTTDMNSIADELERINEMCAQDTFSDETY